MYRVKLNFSKLTIPEKIQKAKSIVGKMDGNEHFPAPDPSLTEVTAAIKGLEDAHEEALDGGKSKKVIMHSREDALDDMIFSLGASVQTASKGDREIILGSGFEVRGDRSPSQPAEAPEGLSAKPGSDEGEVVLSWEGSDGAKSYMAQASTDNGATWTACGTSTKARMTVRGFVSGSKVWFRVAAIGTMGQSPWSDVAQGKVA